jgi:hypothetical protein
LQDPVPLTDPPASPQPIPGQALSPSTIPPPEIANELQPGEAVVDVNGYPQDAAVTPPSGFPYNTVYDQTRSTSYGNGQLVDCPTCDQPIFYTMGEILYINRRSRGNPTVLDILECDRTDYAPAARVNFGYFLECYDSIDVTFMGPLEHDVTNVLNAPPPLDANIRPSGGLPAGSLSPFFDAERQVEDFDSRLWSLEVNHRRSLWDVISTYCGFRYINMRERYSLFSEQPDGDTGRLLMQTSADMYGGQIGADLIYPLGRHCSIGTKGRFGLFLTDTDVANGLINNGDVVFKNCDTALDIAGLVELGVFLNVALTPCWSARVGYEFWYYEGVATIRDQFERRISPGFGVPARTDDQLTYYGATLGLIATF